MRYLILVMTLVGCEDLVQPEPEPTITQQIGEPAPIRPIAPESELPEDCAARHVKCPGSDAGCIKARCPQNEFYPNTYDYDAGVSDDGG